MTNQLTVEQSFIIEGIQHQMDISLELIQMIQQNMDNKRITLEELNECASFDGVDSFSTFLTKIQVNTFNWHSRSKQ